MDDDAAGSGEAVDPPAGEATGPTAPGERIADVSEVPAESSFLFTVHETGDDGDEREAILVRIDGDEQGADGDDDAGPAVTAWINECQHFTHIRLDKGSGVPMRGDEVVCANHGAMFEADTGECTFGPCEGAFLESVAVAVRDGTVYLDDDRFGFGGKGPIERDPVDLASTSNVEF